MFYTNIIRCIYEVFWNFYINYNYVIIKYVTVYQFQLTYLNWDCPNLFPHLCEKKLGGTNTVLNFCIPGWRTVMSLFKILETSI